MLSINFLFFELFFDFVGFYFGLLESLNEEFIVKQVPLGFVEQSENEILCVFLLVFIFEELLDVALPLLFLDGLFEFDDDVKHLIEQPLQGDLEVEHGDLDTNFRRVVRTREFGGHVKLEVERIIKHFISKPQFIGGPLLD